MFAYALFLMHTQLEMKSLWIVCTLLTAVFIVHVWSPEGAHNTVVLGETYKIAYSEMGMVCRAANLPLYWKRPIFNNCFVGGDSEPVFISYEAFMHYWRGMCEVADEEASRFVFTLTNGKRRYLVFSDFMALLKDIIDTHPLLGFLRAASAEMRNNYAETVICRIFWELNRSYRGHISSEDLRHSKFLEMLRNLERACDVDSSFGYFSYEHFFVTYYCYMKISSGSNYVTPYKLSKHSGGGLTRIVLSRIFSRELLQSARPANASSREGFFSYVDFAYFLFADIYKSHPAGSKYWFRVMDLDGDGRLSKDDMREFYKEIRPKLLVVQTNPLKFDDLMNMVWDLVRPASREFIMLNEVMKSRAATFFFNIFVNWSRYASQLVPRCDDRSVMETGLTDWDRFCRQQHAMYRVMKKWDDGDSHEHRRYYGTPFKITLRTIPEEDEEEVSDSDGQTVVENEEESFGEEQEHMLQQYAESVLDEEEELNFEEDDDESDEQEHKENRKHILEKGGRRVDEVNEEHSHTGGEQHAAKKSGPHILGRRIMGRTFNE